MLGPVVQFVLELDRDDRSSGPRATVEGAGDLSEPLLDECEVGGVVGAVRDRLLLHPVGQASVARLAVRPRSDAQRDLEAGRGALVDERTDVELAVEARDTAFGRVVYPEDIRRRDADPSRLQLARTLPPP